MRRYAKSLTIIGILVVLASLLLGFQKIHVGSFERGGDTPLGLELGLDLQGGSHLEYKAGAKDPISGEPVVPTRAQMNSLLRVIEQRVNASGLGEPIIQLVGTDRLLVQLPGVDDPERAKSIIGETAQLVFKHRSLNVSKQIEGFSEDDILSVAIGPHPELVKPGVQPEAPPKLSQVETGTPGSEAAINPKLGEGQGPALEGEATPAPAVQHAVGEVGTEVAGSQTDATPQSLAAEAQPKESDEPPFLIVELTDGGAKAFSDVVDRLIASTLRDPNSRAVYPNRLTVGLEGLQSATFSETAPFVERIGDSNVFAISLRRVSPSVAAARETFGNDLRLEFAEVLGKSDEDIGLTGKDLLRAYPGQHANSGRPIINIEFKSEGARKFGELTSKIVGTTDQIAIFLDNKELIAPVVTSVITGGNAFIQGDFTFDRASDIALLLESGRLPLPIELIKEQNVDAILGADSLSRSVVAGFVGLALVLLFMVLYYRVPGVIASVALIIYTGLVLAIFKALPVTLTLSGVAAVILSIGMAVDANILIFERMKEEIRAGRTLLASINLGFNRAWPAIRDSNVSTLITCGILFWFSDTLGTTVVQGFAITLAIGVATSMFSAIVVSRTLLRMLANTAVGRHIDLFVPAGGGELPQQRRVAHAVSTRS